METETPSPFIGDTSFQWAWNATSLSYLKTCPQLYKYRMIDGWRAKGESVHITFGQLYHSAREHYDRYTVQGMSHDEALDLVVQEAMVASKDWPFEHNAKTREGLIRTIIWDLENYKDDAIKTIILANGKPAVELSFQFDIPLLTVAGEPYVLCGHLDRIVDMQGDLFIADYKTTGSTPGQYYFDQYNPDCQMSLYSLAGRTVYNQPIKGVMIYAMQVAVGFSRPERGMTYRTPEQLDEWLQDTFYWLKTAERYASEGYWPRNDTACHKFGGCTFRDICGKSPSVRQAFLETDFEVKRFNPLEIRE